MQQQTTTHDQTTPGEEDHVQPVDKLKWLFRRMFNSSVARDSKARYVVKFRQQFADMLHIDGNPISYLLPYRAAVAARHAAMADHAMEKAAATVAMQQHTTIGSGTMQQWHQAIKNNTVSAVPKRRLSLSAKASNYMVWTKLLDDQQRPYYYNQSELPVACCLWCCFVNAFVGKWVAASDLTI